MKKQLLIPALFLLFIFQLKVSGQSHYVDSLLAEVKKSVSDTHTVSLYNKMARYDNDRNLPAAGPFAKRAMQLADSIDFKSGLAYATMIYGTYVGNGGNFTEEINYHQKAIALFADLNDDEGQAKALSNLAISEWNLGNYPEATDACLKSVRFYEKSGDHFGAGICQMTLGNIYLDEKDYDEALKCYQTAKKINEESQKNEKFAASVLSNIGNIYNLKKEYDKAIDCYQKAMPVFEKNGDIYDESINMNNIGTIYRDEKKYDEALALFRRCFQIRLQLSDSGGLCSVYQNYGNVYNDKGLMDSALYFYRAALNIAETIKARSQIADCYSLLAEQYGDMKKFPEAYAYSQKYIALNDSLLGAENTNSVNKLRAQFDAQNRDNKIKQLETSGQLDKEHAQRNTVILIAIILGALLCTVVLYNRNRRKQIVNLHLEKQNAEIMSQKKSITDSINYAKKIQDSILPPANQILRVLPNGFILYEPKDVVSGDFYWLDSRDGLSIFAAVDCTGHGVPGALMSVIGFNLLNQAVIEMGLTKPSDILHHLDFGVNKLLRQSDAGNTVKDGMDIGLCTYDPATKKLQFAGVFNPAYIISKGELKQINADKFPIGINVDGVTDNYNNHEIQLFSGDMVYLFSDGYADQFGGPVGKKFKYTRFREVLLKIHSLPVDEQKNHLKREFLDWKGNLEQVDDILVIGMRVS